MGCQMPEISCLDELDLSLDSYCIGTTLGTGTVVADGRVMSDGDYASTVTITDDFTGDGEGEDLVFDVTLNDDGACVVQLADGFLSTADLSSADGSLDAGGPDPVRTLTIGDNVITIGNGAEEITMGDILTIARRKGAGTALPAA